MVRTHLSLSCSCSCSCSRVRNAKCEAELRPSICLCLQYTAMHTRGRFHAVSIIMPHGCPCVHRLCTPQPAFMPSAQGQGFVFMRRTSPCLFLNVTSETCAIAFSFSLSEGTANAGLGSRGPSKHARSRSEQETTSITETNRQCEAKRTTRLHGIRRKRRERRKQENEMRDYT